MNDKAINYEAELGQSSKGFWYAKSVKVSAPDLHSFENMMFNALEATENACYRYNNPEDTEPEEKD